ncbi:hypothetical protein DS909_07485 [Phaeobacter gallaeciensis]|uniref:Uncharacterized protein n=1 Tax=Phaeobacter gallaeciensis TaxID=60890 RepID=A0A366X7M1_9RHOB|nr:hypothetical protein [Phaeobacter gallaeciensis]RBW57975.1 hypothetical protein DS909_07485 [Phaeobacter gallaeciensis]
MPDIVTLKALCEELKIDPREAREKLRAAVGDAKANLELAKARKPRTPWQWIKGSAAEKEARAAIAKPDGPQQRKATDDAKM